MGARLFVGNLSFTTSEDELRDLFGERGGRSPRPGAGRSF